MYSFSSVSRFSRFPYPASLSFSLSLHFFPPPASLLLPLHPTLFPPSAPPVDSPAPTSTLRFSPLPPSLRRDKTERAKETNNTFKAARTVTNFRLASSFLFSFRKNLSSEEKIVAKSIWTKVFQLYFAIEQKNCETRKEGIEFLEIRIEEENRESGDARCGRLVSRGYHDRSRAERSINPRGGGTGGTGVFTT